MKSVLGLIIALCFVLFYIIAILSPTNFITTNFDNFFSVLLLIGFICAILIIIVLIYERLKDRKDEKNDIDKYR